MRYTEIQEARRNAQLPQQQKEYLEAYLNSLPSLDNIYVHYTNADKIGINPRSDWYETPPGIYTYKVSNWYAGPGNYVEVKWKPGFAQNSRWVFVLRTDAATRLLNFGKYSWEQFVKDAQLLGTAPEQLFPQTDIEEIKNYQPNLLAQRIYATAFRTKSPITTFKKLLGYDGVEDPGYGYIHKNEKAQTVFFSRSAFEVLKQLQDYPNTHKYKQQAAMNPQQVLTWIAQDQWRAMNYLHGQKINLPADLQQQLLTKQSQFGTRNGRSEWRDAVKAVANPTEQFLKALIDAGETALVPAQANAAVKEYLLSKDPTSIISMVNPPATAQQILAQHYDDKTVQALLKLAQRS